MDIKKSKFFSCYLGLALALIFCFSFSPALAEKNGQEQEIIVKYLNQPDLKIINVPFGETAGAWAKKYSAQAGVEYAEPNYQYYATVIPSDPYYGKQWYLDKIRAPLAWDKIRETPNVVIAVIDSGVQINHPDLAQNIWTNQREIPNNGIDDDNNGFIDDYHGWDFVNNVPDPSPKFQEGFTEAGIMHGTIVAGIIAAVGNNGSGITGVTWKAKIMPLKVLDDRGEGSTADVIRAIDYAINNKADIINFSFVGLDYSRALFEAIQRAHQAGIIMVAAAGNEQSDGQGFNLDETPMYPACDDGDDNMVIGAAALDALDQKAAFSSYGARCVDVAAPGVGFFSTEVFAPTQKIGSRYFDQYFGGYWSGTSMATPVVAGVLALVEGIDPSAKAKDAQDIVLATADDVNRLNPNYQGKLGNGRVNAFSAVVLAEQMRQGQKVSIVLAPASAAAVQIRENEADGTLISKFNAFDSAFHGGATVTGGDINGDKKEEIIVGAGPGGGPQVKIFDLDGNLQGQFFAYDKSFRGGVKVATADLDNDGKDEIIAAPGAGMKPEVRIFDGQGHLKNKFLAYAATFLNGVNVAVGDVDGNGAPEIITGTGFGGGPQVRIFDANGKLQGQFFAYDSKFRGGVNVTVADLFGGAVNHKESIITAPGKGGGPQIRIFDNSGVVQGQFFAYGQSFHGGVSVAAGDIDSDGLAEIVTGAGPGGGPHVRVFK
ncbi:MAG TPA: S8 family serine peptidase, partial [Candidatus Methylomirabilis sp.]|nr:S8 family serine peptidase [Candidatus Methylomirabilis sp.]